MTVWKPAKDDLVVDLRRSSKPAGDRIGETLTVVRVEDRTVVTSDFRRYDRKELYPISEGPHSPRRLVSVDDPRVMLVRGMEHLRAIARTAENLSRLDHRSLDQVLESIEALASRAQASHRALGELAYETTRAGARQ
jgi:hypothetical protein